MLKEFKAFLLRGNVVDLAVGIVIGAAFVARRDRIRHKHPQRRSSGCSSAPTSAACMSTINDSVIKYGLFLNALVSFLLIGAAVFFFVVKPVNALMARRKTQPDVESPTKECPECLSSIPAAAKRCAFCTASQ